MSFNLPTEYTEALWRVITAVLDEGRIHPHGDTEGWIRSLDTRKPFNDDETVKRFTNLIQNIMLDMAFQPLPLSKS